MGIKRKVEGHFDSVWNHGVVIWRHLLTDFPLTRCSHVSWFVVLLSDVDVWEGDRMGKVNAFHGSFRSQKIFCFMIHLGLSHCSSLDAIHTVLLILLQMWSFVGVCRSIHTACMLYIMSLKMYPINHLLMLVVARKQTRFTFLCVCVYRCGSHLAGT